MSHRPEDQLESVKEYILNNQKSFYRLAYSYTKNSEDALDIIQESICKAIANAHSLKNLDCLKTWFYRIVVNESLSFLRKGKNIIYDESLLDTCASEEKNIAESLSVYHLVQQLEPNLRTVIVLRYFEDLKIEDVAVITKSNLSTVKSRLYKGLKILKNQIGSDDLE